MSRAGHAQPADGFSDPYTLPQLPVEVKAH